MRGQNCKISILLNHDRELFDEIAYKRPEEYRSNSSYGYVFLKLGWEAYQKGVRLKDIEQLESVSQLSEIMARTLREQDENFVRTAYEHENNARTLREQGENFVRTAYEHENNARTLREQDENFARTAYERENNARTLREQDENRENYENHENIDAQHQIIAQLQQELAAAKQREQELEALFNERIAEANKRIERWVDAYEALQRESEVYQVNQAATANEAAVTPTNVGVAKTDNAIEKVIKSLREELDLLKRKSKYNFTDAQMINILTKFAIHNNNSIWLSSFKQFMNTIPAPQAEVA